LLFCFSYFFFFQAEDGIRDSSVTGVQTCALPISSISCSDVYTALQLMLAPVYANDFVYQGRVLRVLLQADASWRMTPEALGHFRSEERRVGKEWRDRWEQDSV